MDATATPTPPAYSPPGTTTPVPTFGPGHAGMVGGGSNQFHWAQPLPQRPTLFGGLGNYINPAHIAMLEVSPAGSEWRVQAVLTVTDRTGQPAVATLTNPLPSRDDAFAALNEIAHMLGLLIRPAVQPGDGVAWA